MWYSPTEPEIHTYVSWCSSSRSSTDVKCQFSMDMHTIKMCFTMSKSRMRVCTLSLGILMKPDTDEAAGDIDRLAELSCLLIRQQPLRRALRLFRRRDRQVEVLCLLILAIYSIPQAGTASILTDLVKHRVFSSHLQIQVKALPLQANRQSLRRQLQNQVNTHRICLMSGCNYRHFL
jgi:hypothetical protein